MIPEQIKENWINISQSCQTSIIIPTFLQMSVFYNQILTSLSVGLELLGSSLKHAKDFVVVGGLNRISSTINIDTDLMADKIADFIVKCHRTLFAHQ